MWDFHLQNHQHFDTFVKDFKEKRLKIKLKYEHKISHVSYVRAHPNRPHRTMRTSPGRPIRRTNTL